ncbi:DNA polymerase III subunit delta [Desulfobulbus rhabdoformis]|uniref:DNA polymerase III subunit delta n=1 Tax=Desulfobulbus rhabdoformis TaxID=34032 RepID=UPI00196493CE|nr:DNA polymerase III subunit delta [Desulfobulbus rhabdoformis]MBM9614350.1 DNA polymerase III subunit delta [Desulfobulbus rhabdoformis]
MPLYSREKTEEMMAVAASGPTQVYLIFGERYLCRNASDQLEKVLLQAGGTLHSIDGDREDCQTTLAKLRGFSLLPGRQVYRVIDTRLFHSKQVAKSIWDRAQKAQAAGKQEQAARALRAFVESGGLTPAEYEELPTMPASEWQHLFGFAKPGGDLNWTASLLRSDQAQTQAKAAADPAESLMATLESGLPQSNILILITEDVDKRKKLFKQLKESQSILDMSVETGASSKAQKAQKAVLQDLVQQTLAKQGKTLASGLTDLLFERVGFHPVAVVMELEKVIAYVGERRQITREDLDLLVGRTRQEALFELTGAISAGNLAQALKIGQRLQENGIHPLAVVATLRNYVRTLMLFRSLLEQPEIGFQGSMSAQAFQNTCLPRLKEREQWKKELSGHPFALYMQFKTASTMNLLLLGRWLKLLLKAELRLKGSPVQPEILLQHLLLSMMRRATSKE